MDPCLAHLLRKTSLAAPSRIFRHAVAGVTFAVGEPPRLHFNSSQDGVLLDTKECITQERLNGFVATFAWDSGEKPQFDNCCLEERLRFLFYALMNSNDSYCLLHCHRSYHFPWNSSSSDKAFSWTSCYQLSHIAIGSTLSGSGMSTSGW
jgi:hypothetical protein